MTRPLIKKLLITFFLVAFLVLLGSFNVGKPRIMVLHSFSQDSKWSRDINSGMQKVLKINRNPVSVQWHYLGLESSQNGERVKNAVTEAHRAINQLKPDVLIAVDDESNNFVASSYAGKPNPKIVFVSILQPPEKYGYSAGGNVSGILENLPLDAVRDALLTIRKGKAARIAALAMDDPTGRAELAQVQSFNWSPHSLVAVEARNAFPEWQRFTARVADQADVLLIMSYGGIERGNGDNREMKSSEVAEWIEKNSAPLPIGICATYVEDGGGLAITPTPVDFGQKAMQMTLKWIEAPKGSLPPAVASSPHFRVGLRRSLLTARGIEMPPIYVEAARIGDAYFP